MKKTLLFMILAIVLVSCGDNYRDSYYLDEMNCFVATEQAVYKTDSTVVSTSYYSAKYPYAQIGEYGYYPVCSYGDEIRYYKAKR